LAHIWLTFPNPCNGDPPEFFELFDKGANLFGKRCALRGGNPLEPQAGLINPQQPQQFPGFFNDSPASNITLQVMTVADVSAGHQYAVGAFQKRLEQKAVIYPAGAHQADQPDIGRILHAGRPGQIRPGIGAPVADKGEDVGFIHSIYPNIANPFIYPFRLKNKSFGMPGRCWMLDTGYWISRNAPVVKSRNIRHPESSIQYHVIFPMTFIKTP